MGSPQGRTATPKILLITLLFGTMSSPTSSQIGGGANSFIRRNQHHLIDGVCSFYPRGLCKFGNDCRFIHHNPEGFSLNRAQVGLYFLLSTGFVQFVLSKISTSCSRGSQPMAIIEDVTEMHLDSGLELSATISPNQSLIPRQSPTDHNRTKIPCRQWKTGSCPRGERCCYLHDPKVCC